MNKFFIVAFMILAFISQMFLKDIDTAIYFILWSILWAIIDNTENKQK